MWWGMDRRGQSREKGERKIGEKSRGVEGMEERRGGGGGEGEPKRRSRRMEKDGGEAGKVSPESEGVDKIGQVGTGVMLSSSSLASLLHYWPGENSKVVSAIFPSFFGGGGDGERGRH